MWIVVRSHSPEVSPILQSFAHPLMHRNLPVRPEPGHFTCLESSKKAFEAFLLAGEKPFLVLEHTFIIGLLLGFLVLVCHRLFHEFSCVGIFSSTAWGSLYLCQW